METKTAVLTLMVSAYFRLAVSQVKRWLEGEDGRVIRQTLGKPTYQATLVKYADIICNKPSGQAKISGIAES